MILDLDYWPVTVLDYGGHAVCFTDYTQSGTGHELTIRDSARDPDNWTPFTIEYPSQDDSRLCDANTVKMPCLNFTSQ